MLNKYVYAGTMQNIFNLQACKILKATQLSQDQIIIGLEL